MPHTYTKDELETRYKPVAEGAQNFCFLISENQKVLAQSQNSLIRWAVDSHHTRRSEQSGFQAVTRLPGFTHQTHRTYYYIKNKNNPEIASEIVFSPLQNVVPLENRYLKYSTPDYPVKTCLWTNF